MKRILIYGDSNTWGQKAYGGRYDYQNQWPNILKTLVDDIHVIQEGLPGRISGSHIKDDNKFKNGIDSFEAIYRSALPVDILVIALGTNDIKTKYSLSADQIIKDLECYVYCVTQLCNSKTYGFENMPKIIFVGIANLKNSDYFTANFNIRDKVNDYLSKKYLFINLDDLEHSEDGIHYSFNDHMKVATKLANKIKELI